jgi:hypothetical protein
MGGALDSRGLFIKACAGLGIPGRTKGNTFGRCDAEATAVTWVTDPSLGIL